MWIESRSQVLKRRFKEENKSKRGCKLAARNWREYGAHEGARERAVSCEAAAQIHGRHARRLLSISRSYLHKASVANPSA